MELTFAREMKAEIVNIRKNEIRFSLSHPLKNLLNDGAKRNRLPYLKIKYTAIRKILHFP